TRSCSRLLTGASAPPHATVGAWAITSNPPQGISVDGAAPRQRPGGQPDRFDVERGWRAVPSAFPTVSAAVRAAGTAARRAPAPLPAPVAAPRAGLAVAALPAVPSPAGGVAAAAAGLAVEPFPRGPERPRSSECFAMGSSLLLPPLPASAAASSAGLLAITST